MLLNTLLRGLVTSPSGNCVAASKITFPAQAL